MGGMGRVFDAATAEYTSVPAAQVIAFSSDLDWATLGAVPEKPQTAYDSLTVGLDAQHRRFDLGEIQEAHAYMESGRATGKLVVTT